MNHKIIFAALLLPVFISPAATFAQQVDQAAREDAKLNVAECEPGNVRCIGVWRGVRWEAYLNTWNIQLDLPSGVRWMGSCSKDHIDDKAECIWTAGNVLSLTRGDGKTHFHVGFRKFPGSEVALRFDQNPPIRTTSDTFTFAQSAKIFGQMMKNKGLRYRWYSWPKREEIAGTLDLADFGTASILMDALRQRFKASD